jgi:hypothetical protein
MAESEGKMKFQTVCLNKWQLIDDEHTFTQRSVCLLFESTRKVKSGCTKPFPHSIYRQFGDLPKVRSPKEQFIFVLVSENEK